MKERYWFQTEYLAGDFSQEKWALHKVTEDEDGEEDDEIILWKFYDDMEGYRDAVEREDIDEMWKITDECIKEELGFLPDYEVN